MNLLHYFRHRVAFYAEKLGPSLIGENENWITEQLEIIKDWELFRDGSRTNQLPYNLRKASVYIDNVL